MFVCFGFIVTSKNMPQSFFDLSQFATLKTVFFLQLKQTRPNRKYVKSFSPLITMHFLNKSFCLQSQDIVLTKDEVQAAMNQGAKGGRWGEFTMICQSPWKCVSLILPVNGDNKIRLIQLILLFFNILYNYLYLVKTS